MALLCRTTRTQAQAGQMPRALSLFWCARASAANSVGGIPRFRIRGMRRCEQNGVSRTSAMVTSCTSYPEKGRAECRRLDLLHFGIAHPKYIWARRHLPRREPGVLRRPYTARQGEEARVQVRAVELRSQCSISAEDTMLRYVFRAWNRLQANRTAPLRCLCPKHRPSETPERPCHREKIVEVRRPVSRAEQ